MMHQCVFLLLVCYSTVQGGPINLFVNVTIDDRPYLEIIEGNIAFDVGSAPTILVPARNAFKKKQQNGPLVFFHTQSKRSQFTAEQITTITNSMRKIEQQTDNCIRFVERTNHPTWIRIYAGTG